MNINSNNRQTIHPLPFIILAGLILGLVYSWVRNSQQNIKHSPTATEISFYERNPPISETAKDIRSTVPSFEGQPYFVASVGKSIPDFKLPTIEGNLVSLSDFKGKAVFINLWASWCPPCKLEMPDIEAAYEKYQAQNLVVLGINVTTQDNLDDVKAFVKEYNLTFPILLDESGEVSEELFHLRGLPTSFFIDSEGILQRIHIGAIPKMNLETFIIEILPK